MKISASIYSDQSNDLQGLVKQLDEHRVDYFHIDSRNNLEVFKDIKTIRTLSKTPIDLHVISSEPESYFEPVEENQVELVTFQFENLDRKPDVRSKGATQLGLAISSETPIEVFEEYRDICSFILFMCTTPGRSGGSFNHDNFKKIRQFRAKFPGIRIHADGGVNHEVSFILRNMGVAVAVSGSYLVNSSFLGAAMINLKSDSVQSAYLVRDFMLEREETPRLSNRNINFRKVLQSIEDFKMGFTLVANENEKLLGLITNADVRRGLLSHFTAFKEIDPLEIMNKNPLTINENASVNELLEVVKAASFPVLFVPVIDESGRAVGVVKFNNLIKGES